MKKNWKPEISKDGIELSQLEIGLKLITTVDPRGWPHITMISFSKAKTSVSAENTSQEVVWGQFTEGNSKKNVFNNPKQGVFFMNADMPFKFLQVKADFKNVKIGGEDCEYFSRLPLLRYLTYTNVWRTFHNSIKSASPVRSLGLVGIIKGVIANIFGKGGAKVKNPEEKLTDFGFDLFNGPFNPKFISYIDNDGYPIVIPCFQIRAPDRSRLTFTLSQFKEELEDIPVNAHVSVFGVVAANLELVNQMVNGRFTGFVKSRGIIEIDEIYNSMPPLAGVIYPKLQVKPKIIDFHL
jgi:hypothetical protein